MIALAKSLDSKTGRSEFNWKIYCVEYCVESIVRHENMSPPWGYHGQPQRLDHYTGTWCISIGLRVHCLHETRPGSETNNCNSIASWLAGMCAPLV